MTQLLWWNFWSNNDPSSEQDRQDHDPIEAGSFVESDRIEKSWAGEKLVIQSLFQKKWSDRFWNRAQVSANAQPREVLEHHTQRKARQRVICSCKDARNSQAHSLLSAMKLSLH